MEAQDATRPRYASLVLTLQGWSIVHSLPRPFRLVLLGALLTTSGVARTEAAALVFCSPGSPGDTAQARPAMEQLARAVEKAGGLPAGSVSAEYQESEAAGLDA